MTIIVKIENIIKIMLNWCLYSGFFSCEFYCIWFWSLRCCISHCNCTIFRSTHHCWMKFAVKVIWSHFPDKTTHTFIIGKYHKKLNIWAKVYHACGNVFGFKINLCVLLSLQNVVFPPWQTKLKSFYFSSFPSLSEPLEMKRFSRKRENLHWAAI